MTPTSVKIRGKFEAAHKGIVFRTRYGRHCGRGILKRPRKIRSGSSVTRAMLSIKHVCTIFPSPHGWGLCYWAGWVRFVWVLVGFGRCIPIPVRIAMKCSGAVHLWAHGRQSNAIRYHKGICGKSNIFRKFRRNYSQFLNRQ